jgi:hypothetical protein
MASDSEVGKIMGIMALAWPKYQLEPQTIKVYARVLADIPAEVLEKAALHLMSSAIWFPAIAEWRKAAFDLMLDASHIPSAFEAWEEVMKQIRTIGSYGFPEFTHPLIERAVKIMGWRELCLSEQIEFERAHFFKVYDSLFKRQQDDIRTLPEVRSAAEEFSKRLNPGAEGVQNEISGLARRLSASTGESERLE